MSQYPFRYECYVMKCLNIIQTVACVNGLNGLFQRKLQLAKYWPEWHRIKLTYLKEIKKPTSCFNMEQVFRVFFKS